MQLTRNNHFQQHDIFEEPLLMQESPTPHSHPLHQHPPIHKPQPPSEEQQPHTDSQHLLHNIDSNQLRFYQEFKKIYTVAHHLALEKKRQLALWQTLTKRIKALQDKTKDSGDKKSQYKAQNEDQSKIKRSRRTAEEIEKKFKCQVPYCERLYGSEGSLQQHIKLKHPELYHKSQCESSMANVDDISQ